MGPGCGREAAVPAEVRAIFTAIGKLADDSGSDGLLAVAYDSESMGNQVRYGDFLAGKGGDGMFGGPAPAFGARAPAFGGYGRGGGRDGGRGGGRGMFGSPAPAFGVTMPPPPPGVPPPISRRFCECWRATVPPSV